MDWKLILKLSLCGLFMGVATVFVIPSTVEPVFWAAIFIGCAYVIAKQRSDRLFLHGFCVSLANCVWITSAHVLMFDQYVARHPQEAAMMQSMPLPDQPRLMMALMGPIVGLVSGLVLGLLSFIAGRIVPRAQHRVAGA